MRLRYVAGAVVLSAVSAAGATTTYLRASRLKHEANRLLSASEPEMTGRPSGWESRAADAQLEALEQRHALLLRAFSWERLEILLILFSVTSAMSSYVLYLYARLREQLELLEPNDVVNQVRVADVRASRKLRA